MICYDSDWLIVPLLTNKLKLKNEILIWTNNKTKIQNKLVDYVTWKYIIKVIGAYSTSRYIIYSSNNSAFRSYYDTTKNYNWEDIPWIKKAILLFYKDITLALPWENVEG